MRQVHARRRELQIDHIVPIKKGGKSVNPGVVTIKLLCDGLQITLAEFFDDQYFGGIEDDMI